MPNYLRREVKSRAKLARAKTPTIREAVTKRQAKIKEAMKAIPGGAKRPRPTRRTRIQQETETARKRAKYLGSPRGLATETVKGLPRAARQIAGRLIGGWRRRF